MPIEAIGCCGAYCGSCRSLREGQCPGCKLGYRDGSRNLSKARCGMKKCCIQKGFHSCADCPEYAGCPVIQEFHHKNGYKYGKYRQAVAYIREYGYDRFLTIADTWKNAYGKY